MTPESAVLYDLLAQAWREGATRAWEESGEGWNSEYPCDGRPPRWHAENPYAITGTDQPPATSNPQQPPNGESQ